MIEQIAEQIKSRLKNYQPQTAIILGSGLGGLGNQIQDPIIIDYKEINGFPVSTVSGHQGRLIIGKLEGKDVLCMQGRIHLYEGIDPTKINLIIKSFQAIGIKNLIVTNAAGSLDPKLRPGQLMLIKDHINFSGKNPLVGPNDERYGPRFPGLNDAYTQEYRDRIKIIAQSHGISLKEGVYLMVLGPNFETAAEIKAFRILGADAVGMSTVPEVLAAAHSSLKILGISVITNMGTGMENTAHNHAETLHQADLAAQDLTILVKDFVREL